MSQIELQPGFDFQKAGKDVLKIEREGLAQLDQYINQDFSLACEKMFYCAGKVVVMGMGKSGHIGRKWPPLSPAPAPPPSLYIQEKRHTAIWAW